MKQLFSKRYKDITTGVFFAIVAVAYLAGAYMIPQSDVVSVGAEFMPKLYGFCLLLVSAVLIIIGLNNQKYYPKEERAQKDKTAVGGMLNVLKVAVLIICYIVAMELVGFVPASIVFLFIMCLLLTPSYAKKNYIAFGIFSIVLPIAAYFIFKNYMSLYLPLGSVFGG